MKKSKQADIKTLEYALQYAKQGFSVLPMHTVKDGACSCFKGSKCPNPGKHPFNFNGVKGASTNRKQIRKWWSAHPEANVGIACGEISNIVAIDVDPRNGGNKTLSRLIRELGELNSTIVSDTGGGGTHHLFACPKFNARKDSRGKVFGPGVDLMADGAIIIVPPSIHASGKPYQWQKGASLLDDSPGQLPKKWRSRIKARQNLEQPTPSASEAIATGTRNETLTSIAGKLHNTGIGYDALLAALRAENQKCDIPLDDGELEKIAKSIGSKPIKTGTAGQGDLAERVMKLVLDRDFAGGDELIYCSDGRFWMYNGNTGNQCKRSGYAAEPWLPFRGWRIEAERPPRLSLVKLLHF
jgi:putative DNA primase/helicase